MQLTMCSVEKSKELEGLLQQFAMPISRMQSDIEVLHDGLIGTEIHSLYVCTG